MSKGILNIVDYGAIADGKTLNTDAFTEAIAECLKSGGLIGFFT